MALSIVDDVASSVYKGKGVPNIVEPADIFQYISWLKRPYNFVIIFDNIKRTVLCIDSFLIDYAEVSLKH